MPPQRRRRSSRRRTGARAILVNRACHFPGTQSALYCLFWSPPSRQPVFCDQKSRCKEVSSVFTRRAVALRTSVASIRVVEAHDVVFAEIAARLHLDDLERHLARVLQAMPHAERNERRFVLAQ